MTKIIWTEPAVADLQAIVDYISRDSETFAIAFAQKVLKAADKLQTFPQIGRPVPESDRDDIKELIFQNYRIIYRIGVTNIVILAILHGSRNLKRMKTKPWEIV